MLHEKKMPNIYWAEAIVTTMYLINGCTTKGVHDITPHEKYFSRKPDLLHYIAYVHISDERRRKLDPKSKKMILINYSLDSHE